MVWLYAEGDDQPLMKATTKADSAYRFDGLFPAEYRVVAELPGGMLLLWHDDARFAPGSTSIIEYAENVGATDIIALRMAADELNNDRRFRPRRTNTAITALTTYIRGYAR